MTTELCEHYMSFIGTPETTSRSLSDISWIVVHHSATVSGNVEVFRKYHKSLGWLDVGYHYVICNGDGGPDGEVQTGRPLGMVGAHAPGANAVSVGICLVGNFMKSQPTGKQLDSLIKLIRNIMTQFNIPAEHVIGHKEVPVYFKQNYSTSCPGDNFSLDELRKSLKADYIGHWAEGAIREAVELGILHGYTDGTFRPDTPTTRAELAVALVNIYKKLKGA